MGRTPVQCLSACTRVHFTFTFTITVTKLWQAAAQDPVLFGTDTLRSIIYIRITVGLSFWFLYCHSQASCGICCEQSGTDMVSFPRILILLCHFYFTNAVCLFIHQQRYTSTGTDKEVKWDTMVSYSLWPVLRHDVPAVAWLLSTSAVHIAVRSKNETLLYAGFLIQNRGAYK